MKQLLLKKNPKYPENLYLKRHIYDKKSSEWIAINMVLFRQTQN